MQRSPARPLISRPVCPAAAVANLRALLLDNHGARVSGRRPEARRPGGVQGRASGWRRPRAIKWFPLAGWLAGRPRLEAMTSGDNGWGDSGSKSAVDWLPQWGPRGRSAQKCKPTVCSSTLTLPLGAECAPSLALRATCESQ